MKQCPIRSPHISLRSCVFHHNVCVEINRCLVNLYNLLPSHNFPAAPGMPTSSQIYQHKPERERNTQTADNVQSDKHTHICSQSSAPRMCVCRRIGHSLRIRVPMSYLHQECPDHLPKRIKSAQAYVSFHPELIHISRDAYTVQLVGQFNNTSKTSSMQEVQLYVTSVPCVCVRACVEVDDVIWF